MRLAPSLLLLPLVACGGDDGDRPTLDRLPPNAFLALHVDLDAVREAEVFEGFLANPQVEEGWEDMQRDFEREMGFAMTDLRAMTMMGFESLDGRLGVLIHLDCDDDAVEGALDQLEVLRRDYTGDGLDLALPGDGTYWLGVDCWNREYDKVPFEGTLTGDGALVQRFRDARGEDDLFGPVEATGGEALRVGIESDLNCDLVLYRTPTPVSVGDLEVSPFESDGFVCRLPEGGVLFGDDIFRVGYEDDRAEERAKAMAHALTPADDDDALRARFEELSWPSTAVAVFRWSGLPFEMREGMVQELSAVVRPEDAAALRELVMIGGAVQWTDGVSAQFAFHCKNDDGAAAVKGLIEDLIDLGEAARELPRAAERVLEAMDLSRDGDVVRLEVELSSDEVDGVFEALEALAR